jgi:hypothetical protein
MDGIKVSYGAEAMQACEASPIVDRVGSSDSLGTEI